jgi:hypothetical protein
MRRRSEVTALTRWPAQSLELLPGRRHYGPPGRSGEAHEGPLRLLRVLAVWSRAGSHHPVVAGQTVGGIVLWAGQCMSSMMEKDVLGGPHLLSRLRRGAAQGVCGERQRALRGGVVLFVLGGSYAVGQTPLSLGIGNRAVLSNRQQMALRPDRGCCASSAGDSWGLAEDAAARRRPNTGRRSPDTDRKSTTRAAGRCGLWCIATTRR